jgi:hypothetical protein
MPVLPRRRLPGQAAFWGSKRLKRKLGVLRMVARSFWLRQMVVAGFGLRRNLACGKAKLVKEHFLGSLPLANIGGVFCKGAARTGGAR